MMKKQIFITLAVTLAAFLVTIAIFGIRSAASYTDQLHPIFASLHTAGLGDDWSFVIYLDVAACLTCTEDIESWRKTESKIEACGGEFVIATNRADSVDVVTAMRLEQLKAPIVVLDSVPIEQAMLVGDRVPAKILFDNLGQVWEVAFGTPQSKVLSTRFLIMVSERICNR